MKGTVDIQADHSLCSCCHVTVSALFLFLVVHCDCGISLSYFPGHTDFCYAPCSLPTLQVLVNVQDKNAAIKISKHAMSTDGLRQTFIMANLGTM